MEEQLPTSLLMAEAAEEKVVLVVVVTFWCADIIMDMVAKMTRDPLLLLNQIKAMLCLSTTQKASGSSPALSMPSPFH